MDYFFQYQFKCSSMTNDFPIIIWVCEMKFRKWICSSIVEWDLLHFPLWITLNLWLVQLLLVFFPLTGMSKFHDLIQLKKKSAGATFYICNSNLSPLYIYCCSICSSQACYYTHEKWKWEKDGRGLADLKEANTCSSHPSSRSRH